MGQLGVPFAGPALSSSNLRSALSPHIGDIVFHGPKKQMVRIDARRVVAFMANKQSFWYRAYEMLIRKSVCHAGFVFDREKSITVSIT